MTTITKIETKDIRFPTSRGLHGSDALNVAPDNSAAYCIIHTDADDGLCGHGFTLTCGRGNEICTKAIEALSFFLVGQDIDELAADMGGLAHRLTCEGQLRWLGPQKGVIHISAAALLNATWDLIAKRADKPVWRLLLDMSPKEIVSLVDWQHIRDALNEDEAQDILQQGMADRDMHIAKMEKDGYPAYTTSVAWLGYTDDQVRKNVAKARADGWTRFKMKVGVNIEDDRRRAKFMRDLIGDDGVLMMDANQIWGVDEAISNTLQLAEFNPWWMEEPTHPDDVLGHACIAKKIGPIHVATGEHCSNAVLFKQYMQAKAMGICQIDSCRLASVNENIAVMLMAKKFNVPVCPHTGGVGLSELIQHLAMFNYIAITGSLENSIVEYVSHLHEHFIHPVTVRSGHYFPPTDAGYSSEMKVESMQEHLFPEGKAWQE